MHRHARLDRIESRQRSFLTAACLAALFVTVWPMKAPAQDSAMPEIVVTAATAEIKDGTRIVDRVSRGQWFRVLKTSRNWHLVEFASDGTTAKGWIYRGNVRVRDSQTTGTQRLTSRQQRLLNNAVMLSKKAQQLYSDRKYGDAIRLAKEARNDYRNAIGETHHDYAQSLHNLAVLYESTGDYAKAEPLFVQTREIYKNTLGETHPDYAMNLANLALLYHAIDDYAKAEPLYHKALSMGLACSQDETTTLSAGWLLNGKAVAQHAVSERVRLGRDSRDPQLAETVRELRSVRTRLAKLTLNPPASERLPHYRPEIEKLTIREQELSKKLGQAQGHIVRDDPWVEVDEVRRALVKGSVLVDIARFDVFEFQAADRQKKWQEPRYVAWVIPATGQGEIKIVDLGKATAIEDAVSCLPAAINAIRLPKDKTMAC